MLNRFHIPLQVLAGIFCAYWFFRPPVPNRAVLALAVIAVLMTLVEMRPWHKAIYFLLVVCLFLIEDHAISKDHADEESRRQQQNAQFKQIADGLSDSIQQAQRGFDATMAQFSATTEKLKAISRTEEKVANTSEENLRQLTGKGTYCYLNMGVPSKDTLRLGILNSGELPVTTCLVLLHKAVSMDEFRAEPRPKTPEESLASMRPLAAQEFHLPPGTDRGFMTDIILPSGDYYVQIWTRNEFFYETMSISRNESGGLSLKYKISDSKGKLLKSSVP